jgi:hypothetical protein
VQNKAIGFLPDTNSKKKNQKTKEETHVGTGTHRGTRIFPPFSSSSEFIGSQTLLDLQVQSGDWRGNKPEFE